MGGDCCKELLSTGREDHVQYKNHSPMDHNWPHPNPERTVLYLPRELKFGEIINMAVKLKADPERFSISLATGLEPGAHALQFQADFLENTFNTTDSDHQQSEEVFDPPSEIFKGELRFTFTLTVSELSDEDRVILESSISTKHSPNFYLPEVAFFQHIREIKYLILNGDVDNVEELQFKFV